MEHETKKTKMEPGYDLEMRVDKLESLVAFNQQKTEKLKLMKTEEAIHCGENRIVTGLKKNICELENQILEKDLAMKVYRDRMQGLEKGIQESERRIWIDDQIIKEMKCSLSDLVLSKELLRQKNAEANRTVEELTLKLSACKEEKKMADGIREDTKRRESENARCVEDLWRQNLEASRSLDELRLRVTACEEEIKMADRVREEMKVRESDLRRELSRVEQSVKEMKERGLEACKAAEVNIKRFGNVVPIAEDLCKLFRMNVEDLVSVKDKFVSAGFGDGATTAHGAEGSPYPSKVLELTLSEQSTKSKKRYSPETQTMPSSAAVIMDCGEDEKFISSLSYKNSLAIPKRKRSKRVVVVNKSLMERKWMYGADMVRAFEEDDELCLHAVCTLYRQLASTSESAECPSRRFYHFEAVRGRALAFYLIGGDPELKLTKSVDEVRQQYPNVVHQCRRLAICYSSYFTAMPSTHEPLSCSLSLPLSYVGACETYCSEGEGEDVEPVFDL